METDYLEIDKLILDEPKIGNLEGRPKYICDVIKELIKDQKGLKAFAIYGKWGSGKTSICRTIHEQFRLERQENLSENFYYIPIWFDAWRFQHENVIYPALLRTIGNELIKQGMNVKGKKLKNSAGKILKSLVAGTKANIKFLEFSGKDFLDELSSLENNKKGTLDRIESLEESPYFEAYEILESIPNEIKYMNKKLHLLIFIDDLDRCLPDVAFSLIEQLKIWFDINGYTVCLALKSDEILKVVAKHLTTHLNISEVEAIKMASDYLLKVITLGIYIEKQKMEDKIREFVGLKPEENSVELKPEDEKAQKELKNVSDRIIKYLDGTTIDCGKSEIDNLLKNKSFREQINIKNEIFIEKKLRRMEIKEELRRKNNRE